MHQAQGEGVGWNQQRQGRALTTLGGAGSLHPTYLAGYF